MKSFENPLVARKCCNEKKKIEEKNSKLTIVNVCIMLYPRKANSQPTQMQLNEGGKNIKEKKRLKLTFAGMNALSSSHNPIARLSH